MDEATQRAAVVAAARSWIRTPYAHMGRVKGVGVDCATLLVEAFEEAGVIGHTVLDYYPPEWHLHHSEERYLKTVERLGGHRVSRAPQPADIAIWRFGRCFSHGAIVVEWPVVVHAYVGRPCSLEDVSTSGWLTHIGERGPDNGKLRPMLVYSCWPEA